MEKKLLVNLFSGPGGGKSLVSAELYQELKKRHYETELVSEFAKECVLEGNLNAIKNQIYLFGCQLYRQECAYDVAQITITDSPLLLNCIYNPDYSEHLVNLVFEQHCNFNNLNIMLNRGDNHEHSMSGRIHSLTESIQIDKQIRHLLDSTETPYVTHDNFKTTILDVVNIIESKLGKYD